MKSTIADLLNVSLMPFMAGMLLMLIHAKLQLFIESAFLAYVFWSVVPNDNRLAIKLFSLWEPTGSHLITTVNYHSSFRSHCGNSAANRPHCRSQQFNHCHSTNHAIQSKLPLPHRRQRPPANKRPAYQRIQRPSACGDDVQKYSTVRGHGECCQSVTSSLSE